MARPFVLSKFCCRGCRLVRREEKTLKATIEKGMPDGEEIVFKYESEQKPGQVCDATPSEF